MKFHLTKLPVRLTIYLMSYLRRRLASIHKNAFQNQRRLLALHLGDNSLKTLYDDTFSALDGLRSLKLDRNGLEFVYPKSFHGLRNLISLSLTDNRISFLSDDTFVDLRNLSALYLQGNRLEHVWIRTFTGLRSLQTLNLSGNRLSNLPDGVFHNSPSLLRLNLDHNRLKTLRRCAVSRRTLRVRFLSLIDNPVLCECPLAWVVEELFYNGRGRASEGSLLTGSGGGRFVSAVWGTCQSGGSVLVGEESLEEGEIVSQIMSIGNPANYLHSDCMEAMQHECVD